LRDLDRALAINPRLALAHYQRGAIWFDLEDLERAIPEFNCAIELDPQLAIAYASRGLALLRQGKDSQTEQDISRALALDPLLKTELEQWIALVKQRRQK
jgi:tetratricopeptide (TPR) repeat protein